MVAWTCGVVVVACGVGAGETGGADEVRAIAARVLAEAGARSSLMAADDSVGGGGAGYEGGSFVIRGAGEEGQAFTLRVRGEIQFRYYANFREGSGGEHQGGFQTRRTRIALSGRAWRGLDYRAQLGVSRSGGRAFLEFAYARYRGEGWYVRAGQMKAPLLREELVSARRQLVVERSIVNEVFTQNYSQGVDVGAQGEWWRVTGAFSDGLNTSGTDPGDERIGPVSRGGEADWALTARGEWKAAGSWSALKDFTSPPGSELAALVGAAWHSEGGETEEAGDYTLLTATGDVSVEGDGWNAFASYVWRRVDSDRGTFDDMGVVAQAGVFIPGTDWEVYARYDVYLPDTDGEGDDPFNTVTLGANWYIHSHAAKFTIDAMWSLDDAAGTAFRSSTGGTAMGFLGSTEPNEVVLRAQFQLLF